MKNKIMVMGIVLSTVLSSAYAGHMSQDVTVCLNVSNNLSGNRYSTSFTSTDIFDHWRKTRNIDNGEVCVTHHYKHGPKNIRLALETADGKQAYNQAIISDKSTCAYLQQDGSFNFYSDKLRTTSPTEVWRFNLAEAPFNNANQHVFNLTCAHQAY